MPLITIAEGFEALGISVFHMLQCITSQKMSFSALMKSAMLFLALFVFGAESMGQSFGFSSSGIVIITNGTAQKVNDKGVLVIQKEGSGWICQLNLGESPGPVDHLKSLVVKNAKGVPYVVGEGKELNFEINRKQLSITAGGMAIVFPTESLGSDYINQLATLIVKLESTSGGTDAKKSSSPSNKQNNSKSSLAPTSEDLTPLMFAKHPFGFMPQGPMTQAQACSYLRQANWHADPYSDSLISIISCTAFKIPFKMYGREVSMMSMSWYNGKNTSYDLTVSNFKSNWSKSDAIAFAQRIYDNLIKNGYSATNVKISSSTNYYEKAVKQGNLYIKISVSQASKLASLDAFAVEMKVEY